MSGEINCREVGSEWPARAMAAVVMVEDRSVDMNEDKEAQ